MANNDMHGVANRQASRHWRLDGSRALLQTDDLRGTVDFLHPCRGLTSLWIADKAIVGWLMAVDVDSSAGCRAQRDAPWQVADAYVRGSDLVVSYREPLEQPFNMQIYWRVVETSLASTALDLVISFHTLSLEASPGATVYSSLFDCRPAIVDESLRYATGREWSYVEATRPGDFVAVPGDRQGDLDAPFWRFDPLPLEKGVIRRLQLRGAVIPSDGATTAVKRLRNGLIAEQPPLTA